MDIIEFEWWRCVDGYRLRHAGLDSASERFERYRPLDTPDLFARFADSGHDSDGMLEFCNQFGLLGGFRPDIARGDGRPTRESVHLDVLLEHHAQLRRASNLFESGKYSQLIKLWRAVGAALVRTELRVDEDGRLHMVMVPPDLIRALWFQLAGYACSGARLFRCERCNKPFTVGTHTGRRKTAMYCSNACKVAAFQARQRDENKESAN
jgi:hypothetical protein